VTTHRLAALVLVLAAVAGCAAQPAAPAGDADTDQEVEDLYIDYVRSRTSFADASRQDIIDVAQAACAELDRGASGYDLVAEMVAAGRGSSDTLVEDLTVVVGAGVAAYCPEHVDEFDS
jgi:hypothetical protein